MSSDHVNKFKTALDRYKNQDSSAIAVPEKNRYISHQHQLRALELASKYDDLDHKIYYLNLCKKIHPTIIDQADSFVSDANADHKGKLFMWKIKQLKSEWQAAGKDWHNPQPTPTKTKKTKKSPKSKKTKPSSPPTLFDEL